ncbi:MAG: MFS transporter [Rothia sp. (in: high G+C Gram-positive bacteria)]|nr:MFS transporter [Rothia sp. (in: high G+C Gram-positive bacteria)]
MNDSLNDRLDRLPFTHKHFKLLFGAGIGWALDAMDVGLIAFVMAALSAQWGLSPFQTSMLGSIGFVGMALGAVLGGLLADKFGRKQIFAATLLIYGLATGASALATSLAVLMALRFVVGLGLGAELPVASTLVSEFSPRAIRGRSVVILEGFWAVGWIAAACIGAFVVSDSPAGWRWALALGIIPAVYSLVIRWGLPESVRFLLTQGKVEQAQRIVESFEASPAVRRQHSAASAEPQEVAELREVKPRENVQPVASVAESVGASKLWSSVFRTRTAALWTVWFCINLAYYGAFTWIPSLLHAQGFTLVKSFEFTLWMTLAQLPGYACAAFLIEKIGRRRTLALFLVGSAASAIFFGVADDPASTLWAGCLLSFFNLGAWGALYALSPEVYPTVLRGRGTGAAAGFGRVASILAPFAVPVLLHAGGMVLVFSTFAGAFVCAAIAVMKLPESSGVLAESSVGGRS